MPPSNTTPPNREAIQAQIEQQRLNKIDSNTTAFDTQMNAKNAVTAPIYLSR